MWCRVGWKQVRCRRARGGGAQAGLVDLADGIARQGVDDVDAGGHLDPGQTVGQVGEQFLLGRVPIGTGHHVRDRHLAVHVVGGCADHGAFEDRRVGGEGVLDLLGIQVFSAPDDHVLDAVDQGEVAVVVEPSDVAGVQPPGDDGAGRLLRDAEITGHHVRAFDDDFADPPGGHRVSVLVDDADPLARQGRTHGTELPGTVDRVARGGAGASVSPYPLDHDQPETLLDPVQQFLRNRCRPPADSEPQ